MWNRPRRFASHPKDCRDTGNLVNYRVQPTNAMGRWIMTLAAVGMGLYSLTATPSLQQPPAAAPADMPALSALLVTADGKRITTRRAWHWERESLRQRWLDFLGGLPASRAPLKPEILATEACDGFTRQWVRYQVEEGVFTDGYLLTPASTWEKRRPGIVVFHPTTPLQACGVAGLEPTYPERNWQGLQLVRRGYVVWCPRNYINTPGADWAGNARAVLAAHPGWTGMTRMVWDAIRAADFLESLPQVDARRIGCLGHSLGGKEVLYAMAFDARYRVGVSSEGGLGLQFSNWDAIWYLGPQIRAPDFPLEHHQLLALVAPRPFLLLAGEASDNDRSWAFLEAVLPVYRLERAPQNVGWLNHRAGHAYTPAARAVAEQFLDQHLAHQPLPTHLDTLTVIPGSPGSPVLQARLEAIDGAIRAQYGLTTDQAAVGLLDLRQQHLALIHPDRQEYAASVPKIGILLAYFHLHPGAATNLDAQTRHELGLMVKASSNEMATRFSRELGLRQIQDVLNAYQFYDPKQGGGIWVGKHYGQGSERIGDPLDDHSHAATVRQLLRYFLRLEQGTLVSPAASRVMREIFASPEIPHDNIKFVKGLADRDVQILRKWGTWQDWRHDAAIVSGPGRHYILAALTRHPRGDDYLVALARAVDDLMQDQSVGK